MKGVIRASLLGLFPGMGFLYYRHYLLTLLSVAGLGVLWYWQFPLFANVAPPFNFLLIVASWFAFVLLSALSTFIYFDLLKVKKKPLPAVYLLLYYVLACFVFLPLLHRFLVSPRFQWFEIPSASMNPTLLEGDVILVDLSKTHSLRASDIVVFELDSADYYVKRVVGLPGDVVETRGGQVYINGRFYPEPWRAKEESDAQDAEFGVYPIAEKEFFVMGDSREISKDSRHFGPILQEQILGKLTNLGWSIEPETHSLRIERIGKKLF